MSSVSMGWSQGFVLVFVVETCHLSWTVLEVCDVVFLFLLVYPSGQKSL